MNNSILWSQFKTSPTDDLKRQIMLTYSNLVHYVIYHSKFFNQDILDDGDFFQFGIEGLSEAIDRFDPDYGTKFETYAIQRIRGKIIDELRKVQIKPRSKPDPNSETQYYSNVSLNKPYNKEDGYMLYETIPDDIDEPDETLEKVEEKQLLVDTIKTLEERDRLILSLYYYEGLNYREIADMLNITVSRVSQIHSKILKTLKKKLEKVHD
jgi:RNA polymerase sigma factor for flagellar operon FliA